jgi:hypothetical protein
MLNRRDGKYPATCPRCRTELESHDHFIGCKVVTRIKWQTTLLSAIGKQLDMKKRDTNLKEKIIYALDWCALAGRPVLVSGPFADALRAQERIG